MNRRSFLKTDLLLSSSLAVQFSPLRLLARGPVEVEWQGRTYRGTLQGDILVSADRGRTWQRHTRLGAQYSVVTLSRDARGPVVAVIGYRGYDFRLSLSADHSCWRTIG